MVKIRAPVPKRPSCYRRCQGDCACVVIDSRATSVQVTLVNLSECSAMLVRRMFRINAHSRAFLSSFQVTYSEYGDPRQVLKGDCIETDAKLSESQVRVKMLMAPVNPSDINMVEGTYFLKPPLPAVSGNEGVGEVVEVGGEVKHLKPGDWVVPSESGWGTWRQMAVATESELMKVANDVPVLGAATLVVNPCTAYRMLKDFHQLSPGDVVLQNGANSAVGQCVIQLAREMKVKTVNVVRDRPNFQELEKELKDLGADHVVTEEFFRSVDMGKILKDLKSTPKLAFNCVGGKSSTELLKRLGQKGIMVTYGGMSKQPIIVPTGSLIFKQVRLDGYWNTEWHKAHRGTPEREKMFSDLCDFLRSGALKPPSSDLFHIEKFQEAVTQGMSGFKGKKKLLVMDKSLL